MKLVILESPFAGAFESNIRYARLCIKDCLRRGESPIASHLLYTDLKPEERKLGIEAGLAWYAVADACVVYIDHGYSKGMVYGMGRARRHGVEIIERRLYNNGT